MEKIPLIITVVLLVIGSIAYFAVPRPITPMGTLYENAQFKVAYAPDGNIKLFALVNPAQLANIRAAEGTAVPGDDAMVLGSGEAAMMRKENLFTNVGSMLPDFFGIQTHVGGILVPTKDLSNDMHFLSETQFAAITGDEQKVFVTFTEKGMPKFFYRYESGDKYSLNLAEGNAVDFASQTIDGKTYEPLVLGANEAAMMRSELLFKNVGEKIDGFFGVNVVIVGVLKPTGTAVDMMHFVQKDTKIKRQE